MAKVKIHSKRKEMRSSDSPAVAFFYSDNSDSDFCIPGYISLDKCPEVLTAVRKISETISLMTIHLMENTSRGDTRIVNELSKKVDINPCAYMTRKKWIEAIINNLYLYGDGNAVVLPHTQDGILGDLEVIPPSQVSFHQADYAYKVNINGVYFNYDEVLHFTLNPDPNEPWRGRGLRISLKEISDILRQDKHTEKMFMRSPKPSIIVKVDALTEEFSSPKGRAKLLNDYVRSSEDGEPWLIPAEQFSVEQVRPLTIADLAISDSIKLNQAAIASILGVPGFLLGIGKYDKDEWNGFIKTTIANACTGIQQELTNKLLISPKWYWKFNLTSLLDWDLQTISSVFGALSDRGFVTGNEVRDRIGMSPREGLDELRILENYIPYDKSGDQKKLIQNGGEE